MRVLDQLMKRKEGRGMYLLWVPLIGDVRTLMMDEAHASRLPRSSSGYDTNWVIVDRLDKCVPVEALYGRKLLVKEKLKAARDRQKSYTDNRHKPLEFEVGDRVLLKVSPWEGVIHFGKKGKLAPRIKVHKTLRFAEELVEIIDREVKILKRIACRDLEAAFEYPDEFHSPIFTMFSWDGNDAKYVLITVIMCFKLLMDFKLLLNVYVLACVMLCKVLTPTWWVNPLEGDQHSCEILCGYGTKSLELGTSFLSMTMFVALDRGTRSVTIVILSFKNASIDSLLLTPLCCDDIHDVTPHVSALAGCDRWYYVEVSEESDTKPARQKTTSRRVTKKKVTISAADNIIPDPDVALELGKSISLTEAAEEEAARQVYVTHAKIVIVSMPEPARRRPSSIAFRDNFQVSKKVSFDPSQKLKGVQSLTPEEQEAIDTMKALKEARKPAEDSQVTSKEKVILEWGSEQESEYSEEDQRNDDEVDWIYSDEDDEKKYDADDDKSIDLEVTDDEETEDEFVQGEEQVNDDEDDEMSETEVVESEKGDEEVTVAAKADVERLKNTVKDTTDAEINSLLEVKIQSEVPHIQSLSVLTVPVSVIFEPSVLTPIPKSPSVAPITSLPPLSISTIPHVPHQTTTPIPTPPITTDALTITTVVPESNALTDVQLRVTKLEKDVSELKKIDHSAEALATLKLQVPTKYSVKPAPESSKIQKPTIDLEQESEKSASEICKIKREQVEKQKMPKYIIKSTEKASLKEYDQKSALYQTMQENKSFNRNTANHGKKTKKRRTKESESSKKPSTTKETSKGKAPSKSSKTSKSATAKEPVKEPITKVIDKILNQDWFKQPPRPPTPNPEWNKRQVVLDQPKQPWFNQMVSATKDPLTLNDLMTTPIDFSKYVLNRLKIDNLTQDLLLGLAYNLLKGTCTSSIELEYNFQECFNALTDKLDWNNPKGDHYPFDLSKPLPLQGSPGHLTVAVDYFFNNDLEYLKTSDLEKTCTTSITKTKEARYEIVGIEDMTPTLWSTIKHAYDKDPKRESCIGAKGVKVLGVKSVSVKKLLGYGHLEEIMVKRADRQLYKFKEGDFVDLHLNEIQDMLFLVVQHKLFHLNDSDIVDFIVALRMFKRSPIIKKRVEDLQLEVESYQKKLNITAAQKTFPDIEFKELYTSSYKPPGVIYKDLNKQKRVMQADELY
ncbi:hypothetical protein Tco_0597945 [Tanacetum coccineum]